MSPLTPLISLLLGMFGIAFVGAQVMEVPTPMPSKGGVYSTPATVPASTCPDLIADCPFGFMYDNSTGCTINECAPDPAIKQLEYDAQCVKDQQRSLKEFERYNIKDTERRFKELERGKFTVPAEARTQMEQMKSQWQTAQALTTCQELGDASRELNDSSNDINALLRDAEDAMNAARCLKDAQRELKDFERYGIKDVERKIQQAKKKRVAVPEGIVSGLEHVKTSFVQAKNADNCTDINDAKSEMYNANNDVQEAMRQLDLLMQMPQMLKQITRELKNIERQWKTATTKAKRSKADLSDLVARGQSLLDSMKAIFEEIKAAAASGDLERIRDVMEDSDADAREHENEIFEIIRTVEALSNAPRYIKELDRRMKNISRQAKDMQRFQKIDTSTFTACLDNVKPLITAAKEEAGRRPADPDATMDAFSTVEEAFSDCEEIRRSLEGSQEEFFGEFIPDQMMNGVKGGPPQTILSPPTHSEKKVIN